MASSLLPLRRLVCAQVRVPARSWSALSPSLASRMEQPSAAPSQKVTAGLAAITAGGAVLATILSSTGNSSSSVARMDEEH